MQRRASRRVIGLVVVLALAAAALIAVVPRLLPAVDGGTTASRSNTVSVDDFGAEGDGRADDGPAIRRAIAAVRPGDVLRFASGKTYLSSSTIEVADKTDLTIDATGAALTTTASTDTSSVMRVENCADVRVIGGRLFHKVPGVRRNAADGLTINQCTDVTIRNVSVGYVYSMGIRVAGSRRVTVSDCTVKGSMADGIGTYGGQRQALRPEGAVTSGSKILTSTNSAFRSQDVGSTVSVTGAGPAGADLTTTIVSRRSSSQVILATAAGSTVSSQFVKILRPSSNVAIVDNRLMDTGDDAVSSVGYLTYSGPNTAVEIRGNTITDSRARGILLTGTSRATVTENVVRRVAMAGVFLIVEVGEVTTWGCSDIVIDGNTVETSNTDYDTNNYPGIGAASTDDEYPIQNVRITNNTIKDAYSYYIGIGGFSRTNGPSSTRGIVVQGNECIGGNRNNPGVQVIKSTDVSITENRIEDARASAITVSPEVAGRVIVRDNTIARYDLADAGYPALDVQSKSPVVANNTVDGSPLPSEDPQGESAG